MYAYIGKSWSIIFLHRKLGADDHLETAVDQALAVERHGIGLRLQAWVLHRFLHPLVAHRTRGPGDPRENHRLIVLELDRHGKRSQLALRHVVSPAFDNFKR